MSHAVRQTGLQEDRQAEAAQERPTTLRQNIPRRQHQPEEAPLPAGQGEEGQHHSRHHHERLHHLLATLLRPRTGQAVPRSQLGDPEDPLQSLPVAGLREQPPKSDHLRHLEQGLQEALSGDTVLSMW